jgi:signal transduction histidine kinase
MPEQTRPREAIAPDLVSPAPVTGDSPACGSPAQGTGSYRSLLYPGPGVYAKNVLVNVAGWLRGHPWQADALLAAALLAISLPQVWFGEAGAPMRAAFAAVTVVLAATLIPRRRYPVAAFGVAAAIGAAQIAFGVRYNASAPFFALQPTDADVAILVLLYTLAAHRQRRVSITALVICLVGSAVAIGRWSPAHHAYSGGTVLGAAGALGGLTLTAWVLGDSVAYRYRRAHYAVVEARAAQMEAERDAQARIAAAAERARELQEKRARAVDQSAARLRRIERDLHDGAQVRLAALAMMLGEIKEILQQAQAAAEGDGHVRTLVNAAHRNAKETLAELRDLARGIHPPVLDRGLAAALCVLTDTVPIPVKVDVRTRERPSAAIEAIAYFCAAELLANITKHSGASRAAISVSDDGGKVLMTVSDDGGGGAWLAHGGGLAGLRERVHTVDGRLAIDSPPGGPTSIMIELPGHA